MLTAALASVALIHGQGDLVAKVRTAVSTGKPAWAHTTSLGKGVSSGLPATFDLQFSRTGKYALRIKSEIPEGSGYDGKDHWVSDRTGAPRIVGFETADSRDAISSVITGSWIDPATPVTLSQDGSTINVKLKSGQTEKIEIDPETNLPKRAIIESVIGNIVVTLADWKPAGDRKLPFAFEISEGGQTDKFQVEKTASSKAGDYAMPKWTPTDSTFNVPSSVLETKRAISGHLLVHPLVNGKDVGWFILDSGAGIMCIDPEVADALEMPKLGKLVLVGVGGMQDASFRKSKDFTLGPVTIQNLLWAQLPLKDIGNALRVKLAGIVGYDFFRRTIVSVEGRGTNIEVSDPSKYKLPQGAWTPMWFSGANPVIEARFEGDRKGFFRLDTGAGDTVTFHAPYVEAQKMLENRETHPIGAGGVGGTSAGRAGILEWFEIGGHRFEKPTVGFSLAKTGAFADRHLAGNIGQGFMTPFITVFDFGGSRMAFLPKP